MQLAWQSRRQGSPRKRFQPIVEALEERTLMSFAVSPSVDLGRVPGNQNEASLAINPTNPNNLVAFSNDLAAPSGIRVYRSVDGGASWTSRVIANGDGLGVAACCDAQAAFDQFGNLFATYIDFSTPSAIKLLLSIDGGANFVLLSTIAGAGREDQPSVATGAGMVWVSYHDSLGSISARGAQVNGLGQVGAFSPPETAAGSRGGNFGNVSIGPTGQVLVTYEKPINDAGPASIYVNLDADGLGPGGFAPAIKATDTNVGGFDPIPAQPNGTVDAEANLAYDRSGRAHNGRVYLVCTDAAAVFSADLNIFVRFSDNDGATWSSPVRVNDDGTANSQFLPQLAVDQGTGNLAVAWYDSRNAGPANEVAQIIAAVSTDGGSTFYPNVAVSSGISRADVSGASNDFGDYMTMDYVQGAFYPVWADNSFALPGNPDPPHLDIATARVVFIPPSAQQTAFVTQMFRDLLHRDPDPAGLTYFSGLVSNGVNRGQLAAMIENTNEFRTLTVQAIYSRYLGRTADTGGLNYFAGYLAGGGSDEEVAAAIAGSPEYFLKRGGGSFDGFLSALYQDALGRPIDSNGQAFFERARANGASLTDIARSVLRSSEYDRDLVASYYSTFLRRQADAGGLDFFAGQLQLSVHDEQVIAALIGSDEYFAWA